MPISALYQLLDAPAEVVEEIRETLMCAMGGYANLVQRVRWCRCHFAEVTEQVRLDSLVGSHCDGKGE